MKKLKKLIALLLVFTMVFSMAACSNKQNDETTAAETTTGASEQTTEAESTAAEELNNEVVEYYMQKANEVVITDTSVTFTDDSGRGEITIEKNPQNAAVLYGSLACLWYEAGGEAPLLIGGDSAVELYLEQIGRDITQDEGVTVVSESSSGTSWDIETIIANHPDLIVCSMGMKGYESIGSAAEAAGIPVIAIQYDHVQDYLKWFKVFCNINGQPELWAEIANDTAEKIIDVVSRVPKNVEKPRVLALSVVSGKLKAYGSAAAVGTILMELGAENVIDVNNEGTIESIEISMEDIYALAPDIITVVTRGAAGLTQQQLTDLVGNDPVWASLDAVKNDKVIYLDKGLFFNKPNQRYQEAYLNMGAILYPDEFGDEIVIEENYDGVLVSEGMMDIKYAEGFSVEMFKGGYRLITDNSSESQILVVPEGMGVPEGLSEETQVLQLPVTRSYLCASNIVSMAQAFGALDKVTLIGTAEKTTYYIDDINEQLDSGYTKRAGGYTDDPDYELIASDGTQVVVFNGYDEEVFNKFRALDIVVICEENTNEPGIYGRLEWMKLLGVIYGMEDEAFAYYNDQVEQIETIRALENTGLVVGMGAMSSSSAKYYGRKSGDFQADYIRYAGGLYNMEDYEPGVSGSATLTAEDYYLYFKDCDVLIWNFSGPTTMEELAALYPAIEDFKAYQNDQIYLCAKNFIQGGAQDPASIVSDIHTILTSEDPDVTTDYIIRLPWASDAAN